MTRIGEGAGALALLLVAVFAWNSALTQATYAAVPEGAPEFVSTRYSGSSIAVATACVLLAVLLAVDAVRRTVVERSHTR